jgi:hypothetical protein
MQTPLEVQNPVQSPLGGVQVYTFTSMITSFTFVTFEL